jgi:hypothetical protein
MAVRYEQGNAPSVRAEALAGAECCATNYSAAWDASGELIAFVVDNLLCPEGAAAVRRNALAVVWETRDECRTRSERFGKAMSSSSFPGVMGLPISLSTARLMERCVHPYLQRALRSSSQYAKPGDKRTRAFSASMDLDASFYGSVSLPPELLQPWHRGPHIDKDEDSIGLAMVYTVTRNQSYDVTGTAFTRIPGLPSLSQNMGDSFHRERRLGQLERSLNRQGSLTYLASTTAHTHRYQDVLHLVRNRYNRVVFYPTNRLHTAFIPASNLLVAEPRRGRLTLNSFWYVSDEVSLPRRGAMGSGGAGGSEL